MNWKLHAPVIKVVLATGFTWTAAFAVQLRSGGIGPFLSWSAPGWIAAGALYTHLFEYFYHREVMHRIIGAGAFQFHDKRHLDHHRIFAGSNFQSRRPEDLAEVTTRWYVFPVLFALHYATFRALFPAEWAAAFFLGVSVQFLLYEVSHWLTHLGDNAFDRWALGAPLLGRIRNRQVKHHRRHHQAPGVNFNFTPPYLGDRMGRTRDVK